MPSRSRTSTQVPQFHLEKIGQIVMTVMGGLVLLTIGYFLLMRTPWWQEQHRFMEPTFPPPVSPAPSTSATDSSTQPIDFSESAARTLATHPDSTCLKVGTIGTTEVYNPNSQTWWFTLTPTQPKAGCKPACVVSASGEVEINWRCTGLLPPTP